MIDEEPAFDEDPFNIEDDEEETPKEPDDPKNTVTTKRDKDRQDVEEDDLGSVDEEDDYGPKVSFNGRVD